MARRRARAASAAGFRPRWSDLLRLRSHHSAPPSLAYSMGKAQKWEEWKSSPKSWQLWRGSWSQQKGDGKNKGKYGAAAFPAYDAQRQPSGGKGNWQAARYAENGAEADSGSFTSLLQASLYSTRKSEQRVVSVTNALARREELWQAYERDIKAAYRKEHTRFLRDMEKLRDDLQKAHASQAGSRAELVRVFANVSTNPVEPEADDNVDGMFSSWRGESDELDARSVLHRAMQAAGRPQQGDVEMQAAPTFGPADPGWGPGPQPFAAGGPPPGLARVEHSTAGSVAPAMAMPEYTAGTFSRPTDGNSEMSVTPSRDPYMTSPISATGAMTIPSPGQHFRGPDGTRLSVKTRPPPPAPPSGSIPLQGKLDARRQALRPFGSRLAAPAVGADGALDVSPSHPASSDATAESGHPPFMTDAEIQARLSGFTNVVDVEEPPESSDL